MTALIEKAMMLTKPAPSTFKMREELEALQQTEKSMLGVENNSKAAIKNRIHEITRAIQTEKFSHRIMPFDPLGWRRTSGLPKLALLSLRNPQFIIDARLNDFGGTAFTTITPDLPKPLAACYRDVCEMARGKLWRSESRITYSYTFRGVIPAKTKVALARAIETEQFEDFFMLIEVPENEWQVSRVKGRSRIRELAEMVAVDPIILGWAHEHLWVIDKFDTTTLEQYVLEEFSVPALGMGTPAA